MKSLAITSLFIFTVFGLKAQSFSKPVEFNDFIVAEQTKIGEKIVEFSNQLGGMEASKETVSATLEDLISTAKTGLETIKKITPYDGGTQLKQSAVELFQFYVQTIDNDYREMVNLIFGAEMDDATIARLNTIVEKVQNDEAPYDQSFTSAQQAFADKYGFELLKNELQEEIDKD